METKELNAIIKKLEEELGDALLATDIWTTVDGQSLAGFNPQPKACALFNRMTSRLNTALKSAKFPMVNKYFLLHLEGDEVAMTIPLGDYHWGMLVDAKKAQLGLILNVVIPDTIDAIKKAVTA
jgi:hypothetical protein